MKPLIIRSRQGDYQVEFVTDVIALVGQLRRCPASVVVIDQNVADLYAGVLERLTNELPSYLIAATEEEKTLTGIAKILSFMQKERSTRQSTLIAIGGGVVQDIATFASHVYYRGVKWVFVPTTLLAMCDSCIGAKCGINFGGFKNQLGVFHSPTHVFITTSFLGTLPDDYMLSGYGEMLKLSLTGPAVFFDELVALLQIEGFRTPAVEKLIHQCLTTKQAVIDVDEYETGLRRILNYGHTFGHALEAVTEYETPHGLGVAWGIDLANWIAYRRGILTEAHFLEVHQSIAELFGRPVSHEVTAPQLVEAARRDKKVVDDKVNLVVLERPGALTIIPFKLDSSLEATVAEYLKHHNVFPGH